MKQDGQHGEQSPLLASPENWDSHAEPAKAAAKKRVRTTGDRLVGASGAPIVFGVGSIVLGSDTPNTTLLSCVCIAIGVIVLAFGLWLNSHDRRKQQDSLS